MDHPTPNKPHEPHKPHVSQIEDLDEPLPPDLEDVTDELEDGMVPPLIDADPEHDRLVDPEGGFER